MESSDANFLMEPYIDTSFDGPQFDDILGAQRLYGDQLEEGGGNDTVATATALGPIADGQTISLGVAANDTVVDRLDTDLISIDDNTDVDTFSFTVSQASELDLLLTPLGPTYSQGPQGGTQTTFDSSALSDLSVRVLDSNGVTVLDVANDNGLGGSESLSGVLLGAAGQYFVQVSGANDAPSSTGWT